VEKIGMAINKNYHNPHNKLSKKRDNSNCVTIVKKIVFCIFLLSTELVHILTKHLEFFMNITYILMRNTPLFL